MCIKCNFKHEFEAESKFVEMGGSEGNECGRKFTTLTKTNTNKLHKRQSTKYKIRTTTKTLMINENYDDKTVDSSDLKLKLKKKRILVSFYLTHLPLSCIQNSALEIDSVWFSNDRARENSEFSWSNEFHINICGIIMELDWEATMQQCKLL